MNGAAEIRDKASAGCIPERSAADRWLLMPGGLSFMSPAIRAAHECGLKVVTLDYLPGNPAHKESDSYVNADVTDYDAVKAAAEKYDAAGILAFAVDPAVETAARVAESLGLPFAASADATSVLQNKDKFRKFLSDNAFNVPRSVTLQMNVEGDTDINNCNLSEFMAKIEYLVDKPLIIKPVDSAGSKGVTKVCDASQIEDALRKALSFSRRNAVIAEEFIEASGYPSDCEMFLEAGRVAYLSFSSQWFDASSPNPYVPAAFTWPSSFTEEQRGMARVELQRLSDLLGLRSGIFNVEMRFSPDGLLYLMEVSPRAGGNRLAEMMERIDGVPLIENAVRGAAGMPLKPFERGLTGGECTAAEADSECGNMGKADAKRYYAEIILHSRTSGRFRRVAVSDVVADYVEEIKVSVSTGDRISEFTGANQMLGTAILSFPDADIMHRVVSGIVDEGMYITVETY